MNKMIMLFGLLVAIMSVSAFGAGFLGTPTAELEKGQWSAGFSYTFIDADLEKIKITEKWQEFGAEPGSGVEKFKLEMEDVKTQRYYGTIGYGVADWCEVFVQLGFADVKGKVRYDAPGEDWDGLNFDNDFAWGLGTRITFYEQNNIRWGTSVQMNWLDTSWDKKGSWDDGEGDTGTWKDQFDYETYDLLIAVGPTVDMGGWKLYGGPFYYYLSGDLDFKGTETWPTGSERWKGSGDLEADSNFGGFVGAQFPLTGNCDMTTELSFTGDSWAIGTGIVWKF